MMPPKNVAMEAQKTALIVFLLTFAAHYSFASEICEEGLRTRVKNGTVGEDGSLHAEDGTVYPNNTFWQEDHFHWACPCLSGPCVRICALPHNHIDYFDLIADYYRKEFEDAALHLEDASQRWKNENSSKRAYLKNLFKLVHLENETINCTVPGTKKEIIMRTILHDDGSLFYIPRSLFTNMAYDPDQFCLFPLEWLEDYDNSYLAMICVEEYKSSIYDFSFPSIYGTSIFFLVLTLIAQYLADKGFKSLHAKLLVHHCVSLICYYLVLLILLTIGHFKQSILCDAIAFLIYYLRLVACFWLNVMCYEIYSTFKSKFGKHNLKIQYLVLYAWGCPLVFTLFALLMQNILPWEDSMNPKLGYRKCWFAEMYQEFYYYQFPTMILFASNIVFFVKTARVLRRLRKESSAALSTDESNVHQDDKKSSKSRLSLYLKLFLLMGCTWILEFFSFIYEEFEYIWMVTNAFNSLRGVFVFWINVISNPSVRKVVQEKIKEVVCLKG